MTVLVKIGSALISDATSIKYEWLAQKIAEVTAIMEEGHRFLLVSSGAVAAGMELRNLTKRPQDVLQLQLLSGIGQIRLMNYYKDLFLERGVAVAQILLTHHNFSSHSERDTIRQIISAYLDSSVIPIVNENDMVDKEEFDYKKTFTDNDILAALVAVNIQVDLAVLLTDVDGLYAADPKTNTEVSLIDEVPVVTPEIEAMAGAEANDLGLGGMSSKVVAARRISEAGIPVIIASGRHKLGDVLDRSAPATWFRPQPVS